MTLATGFAPANLPSFLRLPLIRLFAWFRRAWQPNRFCLMHNHDVNASSTTQVKNDIINKFESLKGDVSIVFATEFYFWFTKRIFSYSKPFAHVLLECSKPQQPYLN